MQALKDPGAEADLVAKELVDRLAKYNLVTPFQLKTPIQLGAIDRPNAFLITHAVTLPVREGDQYFEHTFGVSPIPSPPHIILGLPWAKKYCPEAIQALSNFGKIGKHVPIITPINQITHTNTPDLSPSQTPKPRVSGGGNSRQKPAATQPSPASASRIPSSPMFSPKKIGEKNLPNTLLPSSASKSPSTTPSQEKPPLPQSEQAPPKAPPTLAYAA